MTLVFTKQPIILVDTSYYVFYRYFATNRWFTFQKKEFDIENIIDNELFTSSFIKHFESDLKKICKKWKTSITNIVFCLDCQRSDIWRNDIYKEYKGNRIQNANFNSKIFTYFINYLQEHGLNIMSYLRLEADDVVYLLQNKIKNISDNAIVVISNDNDYLQIASDRTTIVNMQFKDITMRGSKNAKVDLYNKAIFGDKSDNINKIASYITKEKSLELSKMSYEDMISWLQQHDILDKFNNNMKLIAFDNIPNNLSDAFYENVKIQIE